MTQLTLLVCLGAATWFVFFIRITSGDKLQELKVVFCC